MQFTNRLNLRKPDQDDAYQVDDFNANFQRISEAFAGVPTLTNYLTLEEFIASGTAGDIKKGDTVAINDLIYILVGDNPLDASHYMVYGAEAVVIMHEYIPIEERVKGSLYLQLGKTRRLITKVFNKFFGKTKNLLKITATTKTTNGITFTVNSDGSITANGTASAHAILDCNANVFVGSGKTIRLSGCPSDGGTSTYVLRLVKANTTEQVVQDKGNGVSYTTDEDYYGVRIIVYSGQTVNNLKFYPMLRYASITDDTFEPYKEVNADASTLLFQKTDKKTTNVSDGNNYRFTGKNIVIIQPGEVVERVEGQLYLVVK